MKKYCKDDQKILAKWAADCAERVLLIFEKNCPDDKRPSEAIQTCRTWAATGIFSMAIIRGASLAAHAAARKAKENVAACFAARAAGQAVATAHVPQHAFGASYYALKAIGAADPILAEKNIKKEWRWQISHIPKNLREEIQKRIVMTKNKQGVSITINKEGDF